LAQTRVRIEIEYLALRQSTEDGDIERELRLLAARQLLACHQLLPTPIGTSPANMLNVSRPMRS